MSVENNIPSVWDLKWYFINFTIVFGGLGFYLKGRLSKAFSVKAQIVKSAIESNEEKEREANEKLLEFNNKIKNIHLVVSNIQKDSENAVKQFQQRQEEETKQKIERLKVDLKGKLEQEKNLLMKELNQQMAEEIIAKTKIMIASDAKIQTQASKRLLETIQ